MPKVIQSVAKPEQLKEFGVQFKQYEGEFYGKPFRDFQRSILYLYTEPIDESNLTLQKSEIESVIWMDYAEALQAIRENTIKHCIYEEEFQISSRTTVHKSTAIQCVKCAFKTIVKEIECVVVVKGCHIE